MAYLLDSNLLIYSANPQYKFLQQLLVAPANFASEISRVETLGFHRLDAQDAAFFDSLFAIVQLLPVTRAVMEQAIHLRQQRKMTLGDSLIAATGLEYQLVLATRNTADFNHITALQLFNPFI